MYLPENYHLFKWYGSVCVIKLKSMDVEDEKRRKLKVERLKLERVV
ncbi:MAG: hypothetical protein WDN75_04880 [Bacteroidota bacterium]